MRLFFALEIPGELALQIADWRQRQLPAAGREVPPANFHITLAFLGNVEEQRLEQLCAQTDQLLQRQGHAPGQLHLNQVGYWPRPGIYWLGPSDWPMQLDQLASALAKRGNTIGARHKRSNYRPHLTLFRGCQDAPPAPTLPADFQFEYKAFVLMESRQGRQGVSYNPVAEWLLA